MAGKFDAVVDAAKTGKVENLKEAWAAAGLPADPGDIGLGDKLELAGVLKGLSDEDKGLFAYYLEQPAVASFFGDSTSTIRSVMGNPAPVAPVVAAASAAPPAVDLVGFVKGLEGFSAKAYPDGSQWSIGYGTKATPAEIKGATISRADAEARLSDELGKAAAYVNSINANLPANVSAALISAAYNLGSFGTGLTSAIKSGDVNAIADKLSLYTGTQVPGTEKGVANRRAAEVDLIRSGKALAYAPTKAASKAGAAAAAVAAGGKAPAAPSMPASLASAAQAAGLVASNYTPANFNAKSGGSQYGYVVGKTADGRTITIYDDGKKTHAFDTNTGTYYGSAARVASGAQGVSRSAATSGAAILADAAKNGVSFTYGSRSPEVAALQTSLVQKGYDIRVDGVYGPETAKAVADYQKASTGSPATAVKADGVAGPKTISSLLLSSEPLNAMRASLTGGSMAGELPPQVAAVIPITGSTPGYQDRAKSAAAALGMSLAATFAPTASVAGRGVAEPTIISTTRGTGDPLGSHGVLAAPSLFDPVVFQASNAVFRSSSAEGIPPYEATRDYNMTMLASDALAREIRDQNYGTATHSGTGAQAVSTAGEDINAGQQLEVAADQGTGAAGAPGWTGDTFDGGEGGDNPAGLPDWNENIDQGTGGTPGPAPDFVNDTFSEDGTGVPDGYFDPGEYQF